MVEWMEIPNEYQDDRRYITVYCAKCNAGIEIVNIVKDDYDDIEVYVSPHECSIWRSDDIQLE